MYSTSGEKILEVATRLFYSDGVGAIGVDRVCEEAGASKPTLYAQFGTKASLIAAVLQRRSDERQERISRHLDGVEPGHRVQALFDWYVQQHSRPDYRGCPFTRVAVEIVDPDHPARSVIVEYKTWIRNLLTELARDDGLSPTEQWASIFMLLIDGASARVMSTGDTGSIRDARDAALLMMNTQRPQRYSPDQLITARSHA